MQNTSSLHYITKTSSFWCKICVIVIIGLFLGIYITNEPIHTLDKNKSLQFQFKNQFSVFQNNYNQPPSEDISNIKSQDQFQNSPAQINIDLHEANANLKHSRKLQNENKNTTKKSGFDQYILLIIIVCFVGAPVATVIIFVIAIIYKKCNQQNQQQQQNEENQRTVQMNNQHQMVLINLDQYKIDEIGPYLLNPQDQCIICLDKSPNIRTFCGHLFHGACLRKWFKKKVNMGRKESCPLCMSQTTNPVKIYCKRCHIGSKLDVLAIFTSRTVVGEFDNLRCMECKVEEGSSTNKQNGEMANKQNQTKQPENRFDEQIVLCKQNQPKQSKQSKNQRLHRLQESTPSSSQQLNQNGGI